VTSLEIGSPGARDGEYWVETRISTASGKMEEYLAWLRDAYRPALEKAGGSRFMVNVPMFGSTTGDVVLTRTLQNLDEIDAGPVLARALGPDQARALTTQSAQFVLSSRTRILRLRNDLSYGPSAAIAP
jgi:hypothetical protein